MGAGLSGSTWGTSWGTSWATSWNGSTPAPPADHPSSGGTISGGYFSRKKWYALIGEIEAERAQARTIRNAAQRKAVAPAVLLAAKALKAAREAEEDAQVAADLRAMNAALQGAAGAKSLSIAIAQANEAQAFARSAMAAMIAWQEDEDDEDESIAMLLLS